MERFPKFLKTTPMISGLSLHEMGILVMSLYIGMILHLPSHYTFILSITLIVAVKLLKKYFDLIGFIAPKIKKIDLTKLKGGDR